MTNQHQTVLVIGDSPQAGELLTHMLEECGYQALAEESVGQAIEAMADFTSRTRPSLILCNINQVQDDPAMFKFLREEIAVEVVGFGDAQASNIAGSIKTLIKRPNNVAQMSRLVNGFLSQGSKAA